MAKDLVFRSMFFVPAHIDKFFDKAIESEADALVFDLEDGVPIDKKEIAREILKSKLSSIKLSYPVFVRLNARETGLLEDDVKAMTIAQVDGFVFPKVSNVSDIHYLEKILSKLEKQQGLEQGNFSIFPLIEGAEAVLNVLEIAKSSKRIKGLIFGHEDYLLDLQANHSENPLNLLVPRAMIAMAARAARVQPIDTPYLQIKDLEGCAEHVRNSRELGFSGMLVLHPNQIKVANHGYAPSKEEIERAEKIVFLDNEAKKNNRSIAYVDGKFIAPPILKQAKLMLDMTRQINERK